MSGRTTWWPKDAAWHRRERQVQLGVEFGAEGVHVLDVLACWAQEQRDAEGYVRGGFLALSREAFVTDSQRVREIVEFAASIGALDELELDSDGRRFACRISGWEADTKRGTEAVRKAGQRAQAALDASLSQPGGTCPTQKGLVPQTKPNQTIGAKAPDMSSSPTSELFAYWQQQTNHPTAKLTRDRRMRIEQRLKEGYTAEQVKQAIDGAARAAFVNDSGKRFDDIELICRSGSKLESFIERSTATPLRPMPARTGGRPSASDLLLEINGGSIA